MPVTLRSDESVAYEHLGFSVATGGDSVAVGAKDSNRAGPILSGAVIVFARDEAGAWRQSEVLTSPDAEAGDNFGFSMALAGDILVVGAPFSTVSGVPTGATYVFQKSTDGRWVRSTTLSPLDGQGFELFGLSVATDGERIVVGASQSGDVQQGAAFVYQRDGSRWQLDATLQARDGAQHAQFGIAVAISGSRALVGAAADSQLAPAAGSAYIFERESQGWSERFKFMADDAARADFFGRSVALSRNTAVIGTYLKQDRSGNSTGAVYVFRDTGSGWIQQEKIVPSDAAPGDAFGTSLSLVGNVMAIGSPGNDGAAPDAGAIYIFQQEDVQWKPLGKLYQATSHDSDEYGRAVMLSDDGFVVAGAWRAGPSEAGAAAISALSCPWR